MDTAKIVPDMLTKAITDQARFAKLRGGLLGTPDGPRPPIFNVVGAGAEDTPVVKAIILRGGAEEFVPADEATTLYPAMYDTASYQRPADDNTPRPALYDMTSYQRNLPSYP